MKNRSILAIIGLFMAGLIVLPLIKRVEYRDFEDKKTTQGRRVLYYSLQGSFSSENQYIRATPYEFVFSVDGLTEEQAKFVRLEAVSLAPSSSRKSILISNPKRSILRGRDGSFSAMFVFPPVDFPYEDCIATGTLFVENTESGGKPIMAKLHRRHRFETIFLPYEWMLSA